MSQPKPTGTIGWLDKVIDSQMDRARRTCPRCRLIGCECPPAADTRRARPTTSIDIDDRCTHCGGEILYADDPFPKYGIQAGDEFCDSCNRIVQND